MASSKVANDLQDVNADAPSMSPKIIDAMVTAPNVPPKALLDRFPSLAEPVMDIETVAWLLFPG
jgi:hypothetical protein